MILTACSNSSNLETGEIKTFIMIKETLAKKNNPKSLLDTRSIITRKDIDDANIPVLFVELENGQNGTLTLYPGQNIGETWLGADGATITLKRGILKATRGMRNDLMGSNISISKWSKIKFSSELPKMCRTLMEAIIMLLKILVQNKQRKLILPLLFLMFPLKHNNIMKFASMTQKRLQTNILLITNMLSAGLSSTTVKILDILLLNVSIDEKL